ncbi:hypothetical protein MMC10_010999 [Thelotrema lepadinum]|nr:hypothetical protein [Thelotrema lepadinum]
MASAEPHSQANLAHLPVELHHFVLAYLSKADHQALRQTCRSLENITTGYLFFRVCISLLKEDRNVFFNISKSSHLQQVVEQVVWYDIPTIKNNQTYRSSYPQSLPQSLIEREDNDDEVIEALEQIANLHRRAQWLKDEELGPNSELQDDEDVSLEAFLPKFIAALEQMPCLRTMIVRPVPHEKSILPKICDDLPVDASYFRQDGTQDSNSGNLVVLNALSSSMKLHVTSLYLADHHSFSNMHHLGNSKPDAFKNLQVIDLCISDVSRVTSYEALASNLQAATELRKLKLCFENVTRGGNDKKKVLEMLFLETGWEHLNSLELVDAIAMFSTHTIKDFITRHQRTLRHLKFQCSLRKGGLNSFLECLASLPNLHLDSVYMSYSRSARRLSSKWLLAYINNTGQLPSLNRPVGDIEEIFRDDAEHEICAEDDDDNDSGSNADSDNLILGYPTPYWVLEYLGNRVIFYSTADSNLGDYPTETWKFVYRDGSFAYLTHGAKRPDPLEFFEDWDEEQGDRVEPTPYGDEFDMFMWQRREISLDPRDEYPEHARVWLGEYKDEPLTQENVEQFKREWMEDAGSDGWSEESESDEETEFESDEEGEYI